jgi:uncharacterized membrane protein YqjE
MTEHVRTYPPAVPPDASTGELLSRISEQTSRLIRDELRLAQLEMAEKGKRAGIGAGLFGGAGLMAAYGVGCLIAAAILGLALVVSAWLAAILIGAGLLLIAAVAGLIGKKQVSRATPPVPAEAVEGIKQDVHTLKPGSSS